MSGLSVFSEATLLPIILQPSVYFAFCYLLPQSTSSSSVPSCSHWILSLIFSQTHYFSLLVTRHFKLLHLYLGQQLVCRQLLANQSHSRIIHELAKC